MKYRKIMLVDDDEDDQLIFKDAITELGNDMVCVVAKNGYDAFNQLKASEEALPSVIFLDLNMPVMNGFEFLELMRCMQPMKEIPVVVFTTSNDPIDKRKSLEYGVKEFFTKTSDFRTLKSRLGEMLEVKSET